MKEILCFGDSNTWGYDPHSKARYPQDASWTGVLRGELGAGYHVIVEGLNGRTTVWDDPIEGVGNSKNGLAYLVPCLESHMPLDLVIVMLGTNDLKVRYSVSAYDIANSAGRLVGAVQASQAGRAGRAPEVLLIAPPPLSVLTDFAPIFIGGPEKSLQFAEQYRRVAAERGCHYLNAGEHLVSSEADGVHFDPEGHRALGLAVAEAVRKIID